MAEEFPTLHRTTRYAKRIRAALLEKLGGVCVLCGEDDLDKLQFDHKFGRDYNPNKLSYAQRMKRYEREAEDDLLRLLCEDCNLKERKKFENGAHCRTNYNPPKTADMPF